MDEIDRQIIKILQVRGRISIKDLSNLINLTPPAVGERIKRLENQGIILGYRAIIDHEKLGLNIQALINVTMSASRQKEFYKLMNTISSVTECYHVTGTYCTVVKVYCKTMSELGIIIQQIQQYGETNTLMVLSRPISHRPFT